MPVSPLHPPWAQSLHKCVRRAIDRTVRLARDVSRPRRGGRLRLPIAERIDFLLRALPGVSVAFLEDAHEPLEIAVDLLQIVVGELAPLRLHLALHLMPLSLQLVFVHGAPPRSGI